MADRDVYTGTIECGTVRDNARLELPDGRNLWIYPEDGGRARIEIEREATVTQPDTATRVCELAIPRHVTIHAQLEQDALGRSHYTVTGHYQDGQEAFSALDTGQATSAAEALHVVLARLRERGW